MLGGSAVGVVVKCEERRDGELVEEYIKAASAVRNNYKFGNHNECCTMCYC